MKKVFFAVCMAAIVASCATNKKVTSVAALAGEWSITTIEGKAVAATTGDNAPFIGFDTNDKRVYGSTGCNRLTGALNADAEAGTIDFAAMGSTRMMCDDMATEQAVLGAMAKVTAFGMRGKDTLEFKDNAGNVVMTLNRRK